MNRNEMRTLGRIGHPLSAGSYRRRRRRGGPVPLWLLLAAAAGTLATLWVAVVANQQVEPVTPGAATARVVGNDVPARPAGADRASRGEPRAEPATNVFGEADGLALTLPHDQPAAVAFHEASRVDALELRPVGRLVGNDNPTAFTPPADTPGPDYRVLSSQGRARPPTSAVDVAVPLGDAATAPVDGRVIAVTEYPLYGRMRDWRVEIVPEGRPDLTVVVTHLLRPITDVGDTVAAGRTPIGVVRLLPVDSHAGSGLDPNLPRLHLEVAPAVEAEPIDPNAPALPEDAGR